jgi:hypothetical protein
MWMNGWVGLAGLVLCIGCQEGETKGTEATCSPDDLYELQKLCLDYGGDYRGETTSSATTDCEVDIAVAPSELLELSGSCNVRGSGDCVTECWFPDEDDDSGNVN